jgi:hypothetical protein
MHCGRLCLAGVPQAVAINSVVIPISSHQLVADMVLIVYHSHAYKRLTRAKANIAAVLQAIHLPSPPHAEVGP